MLFAFQSAIWAQNLVPNPSFESVGTAPCTWISNTGQFASAINNWSMPSGGTTDIFSNMVSTTCYGHNLSTHASAVGQQLPHTGNVQSAILTYGSGCGFNPNYREYLQAQLTTPLTSGLDYDFEFWISLADASRYASNNFGIRFNTGFTFSTTCYVLPQTPQFNYPGTVTSKFAWIRISGTVNATAAWRYIIIGNFYNNAATNTIFVGGTGDNTRYFIDDISVSPAVLLPAEDLSLNGDRQADGIINLDWELPADLETTSFDVQRSADGMAWQTMGDLPNVDKQKSFSWTDHFPPRGEILYRLRYTDANGGKYSSNTLSFNDDDFFPYRLQIANHPVQSDQAVRLRIGQADDAPATISIMDLAGRTVWSRSDLRVNELDGFSIPAGTLQSNLYVISITTAKGNLSRKLVIQ
jgi:hypothetical protein